MTDRDSDRVDALHDLEEKAREHAKDPEHEDPQAGKQDRPTHDPEGDHAIGVTIAR